jgi:hypothetical protein
MNNVYVAKNYDSIRVAIEKAQIIAGVLKSKKITLNYKGVMVEISANTNMQHAITKYLSILDEIYREQKVK